MTQPTSDASSPAAPPASPVIPVQLSGDDKFQFRCHKGIACFNKCCENIDILLTPYDVLRLKNRFDLTAREFIDQYTTDFAMDGQDMPGLKLRTKPGSPACINLTPEGCGVYSDRPAACRYYALGLVSMRRAGSPIDEDGYFVVREDHCLGHDEPVTQTVGEYRRDQGVDEYDDASREWRQIILKKRSSGPTVGKPSERSLELFFLASYDLDGFRDFIASPGFTEVFDLSAAEHQALLDNELQRMKFGFRLLKQVLFGELTIPLKQDARDKRMARYRERMAANPVDKATEVANAQDKLYDSLDE